VLRTFFESVAIKLVYDYQSTDGQAHSVGITLEEVLRDRLVDEAIWRTEKRMADEEP
jgi:hypothetical protein